MKTVMAFDYSFVDAYIFYIPQSFMETL